MSRFDTDRDRVLRQGRAAWQRLKKEKSWGDWLITGEALTLLRDEAMKEAGTDKPSGRGYNMAMSLKLVENKLDDMDQGDRSRLFECMDNLSLIEQWRRGITRPERMRLNHPSTVMRNWKRAVKPVEPVDDTKPPKMTLRDAVANLSEENLQLKSDSTQQLDRITELEEELAAAREEIASLRQQLDAANEEIANLRRVPA